MAKEIKCKYQETLNIISDGKDYYLRTKELADALKIKQPFEFVRYMKSKGVNILKGTRAKELIDKNVDCYKTTFVSLSSFITFAHSNDDYIYSVAPRYLAVKDMIFKKLYKKSDTDSVFERL